MKKLLALVLVVAMFLVLGVGCAAGTDTPAASESQQVAATEKPAVSEEAATSEDAEASYNIAVVVKITGIPFFNVMEEGVKKAAEEFGVNAYVTGPTDADPAQQVKIIEDLINTDVNAIVVVPNDATVLEPVLKKAQESGILVIANESPAQSGADYDIEMIDNAKFAEAAAESAAKAAGGKGQYVMFVGGLSVPLHNTWADLAKEYLTENYPDMTEATDRIPCGEDAELAHNKTQELMSAYPDLTAIIGWGSLGPIGAAEAIKEKNMVGKIAITGTVVPSQAAPYLIDKSIVEGVLWNPADSGYAAVYVAKCLLSGDDISTVDVPGIGKPTITEQNVLAFDNTLIITADNAESLGF